MQIETSIAAHPTVLHTTIKILQFADGTTLFLRDKEDLDAAITAFNQLANLSGLRMNKEKTEAM